MPMETKRKSLAGECPNSQSPSKKVKEVTALKFLEPAFLQEVFGKSGISQWEHNFYMDIRSREPPFSDKQLHYKGLVELKANVHAAKQKNVFSDYEGKFALDCYGKATATMSEKQLTIKKTVDSKMELWKAFQATALSEWDLEFMMSNLTRDTLSEKQRPIKARIQKQLEAAAAMLEAQVLSEWELGFFRDNVRKDLQSLSEKQRPIMNRIEKKLQAWRAYSAGLLNQWSLDFVKDVVAKETLSEKQQSKLREIEQQMSLPPEDVQQ